MEFLLEDIDIFDLNLCNKIEENMILEGNQLNKEYEYRVTVSFHVELLKDSRFDNVDVKVRKREKNETRKDKIYNLLDFQMDKIDKSLTHCGISIKNLSILGYN
ncbi:hypothetical protein [Paenibacillus sp. LPE1-1-1.1]|uniref:hypothetical protein n=1 Tax=Paenibacillus sp. LPE1-1-1.1 TaxID=3135230 RepID=UPI0034290CEE